MTDHHVHLERGSYTIDWINVFVQHAMECGINAICFVEHTHRFFEFNVIYDEMIKYSEYQRQWFSKKQQRSVEEYIQFITLCKKQCFPIALSFGLEVCYESTVESIYKVLRGYKTFDFLVGAVHWIDGFAFDHSRKHWADKNVNQLYTRYYEISLQLVNSGYFDGIAHPDAIKCFGAHPNEDMSGIYERLAKALHKNDVYAENNAGVNVNYGYTKEIGLNRNLLNALIKHGVTVRLASDAHDPQDVGLFFTRLANTIEGG